MLIVNCKLNIRFFKNNCKQLLKNPQITHMYTNKQRYTNIIEIGFNSFPLSGATKPFFFKSINTVSAALDYSKNYTEHYYYKTHNILKDDKNGFDLHLLLRQNFYFR